MPEFLIPKWDLDFGMWNSGHWDFEKREEMCDAGIHTHTHKASSTPHTLAAKHRNTCQKNCGSSVLESK